MCKVEPRSRGAVGLVVPVGDRVGVSAIEFRNIKAHGLLACHQYKDCGQTARQSDGLPGAARPPDVGARYDAAPRGFSAQASVAVLRTRRWLKSLGIGFACLVRSLEGS